MLHILWLIIKWILILLGILIGLIFLILLLLLFCPIRYRGNLKKDRTDSLREIHATGEVSWLLHIISPEIKMQKNRQSLPEAMKRHQKANSRTMQQSYKCLSLRKILLKI